MDYSLGLIETKGLVAAIEAADAMVKAADVKIISKEKVTGALICIKVSGETAAVKAAVDAGSVAAQRVGQLVSVHVIPRPDNQIDSLLFDDNLQDKIQPNSISSEKVKKVVEKKVDPVKKESVRTKEKVKIKAEVVEISKPAVSVPKKVVVETPKIETKSSQKLPSMDELILLNVHSLRRIARGFDAFPIKGREISKANRAKLLDYFKSLQ